MTQSPPRPDAPELLAPAGDWDCVRAAIANGADAVYFGLDCGFNARARAANFSAAELPGLLGFLHHHGVRGYVTLNTLVFTDELPAIEAVIRQVAAAGADAVLVQDLGLVQLIREVCPDLPIHGSTQMTLTSAECIAAAQALGVERVVLARELSVREVAKIRRQTVMPLEVFVHGALCVAYSGQCLTSESFGGRSANRGQCAQACRLPYDLLCDGDDVDLGPQKYLLSPQDLAAYALVPELIEAGVCSLKIEGRLKTPEYVANITRHYRQAIDAAVAGRPVEFTPRQVEEMELSFSRGFSHGWLRGCDHKALVPAVSSAKRGVLVGQVREVRRGGVVADLTRPVKRGDGLVFDGDRAAGEEQGGRLFDVRQSGSSVSGEANGRVELRFGPGAIDFERLSPGQQIWKSDDPELSRRLRKSFAGTLERRRAAVDVTVRAGVGRPLVIEARAETGQACRVESSEPLSDAIRHPLTVEVLREQLGRLGGTAYVLGKVEAEIEGRPMAPLSVLGKLRHAMVEQLDAGNEEQPKRRIASAPILPRLRSQIPATPSAQQHQPVLRVLCRSLVQLETALAQGQISVLADFQDIREYRRAVELARQHTAEIFLATPRIQKPDEIGIFRVLLRHGADGILVRNLAGMQFFSQQGIRIVADFSLNAANELTVQYLRDLGAERITASYDLNREQLLDLVASVPSDWLEVVVHQHMPMFHMEHCVFCAVLSPGTNKTNCGRPCDRHEVQLRDRLGMEHPLRADVGCRNTLFNAVPQSAAEVVPELLERGVRHYRVELLQDMQPSEQRRTIELYQWLLAGQLSGRAVWTELKAANRVGVTRGTLEERRNPLAIL